MQFANYKCNLICAAEEQVQAPSSDTQSPGHTTRDTADTDGSGGKEQRQVKTGSRIGVTIEVWLKSRKDKENKNELCQQAVSQRTSEGTLSLYRLWLQTSGHLQWVCISWAYYVIPVVQAFDYQSQNSYSND